MAGADEGREDPLSTRRARSGQGPRCPRLYLTSGNLTSQQMADLFIANHDVI
jgi:hypothetical protein